MYTSLIEIGLEDYLKARGGGKIIEEKWTINLDSFVSSLTDEQKKILRNKIFKKKNETHLQHNDLFHEIGIACAFYDNISFLEESNTISKPDFRSNNTSVEVKTINNSEEEQERLFTLNKGPNCVIQGIYKNERKSSVNAVVSKFKDHIEKAKKQLSETGGHIWVVYAIDSPPGFDEDAALKLEIENGFNTVMKDSLSEGITIRFIHFVELRDKIQSKFNFIKSL